MMKASYAFIFLLVNARVKEKDACFNHFSQPTDGEYFRLQRLSENSPANGHRILKRHNIKDTEKHWAKDHQILVPLEIPAFTKKSTANEMVSALRSILQQQKSLDRPECVEAITFEQHLDKKGKRLDLGNAWDAFFAKVSNCHMYPENSDVAVENLINSMSKLNVTLVENFGYEEEEGSQFKMRLTFENGKQAMFKPMRVGIDYETDPDQFFASEMERPNAEIAAFHLDKLLGFRRAVPTVGRDFTISTELSKHTDKTKMDLVYFSSPANKQCFIGTCHQFCDTAHAVCGDKGQIRGSVQAWIPKELVLDFDESLYARSDTLELLAKWQENKDYCRTVKKNKDYKNGRRLLDLVDLSVFDYLTGNQDRHTLEWFSDFDKPAKDKSFIIPLDSGRAFGNPHFDDFDILAPLIQCCVVRPSTVNTLLNYYDSEVSLGTKLDISMQKDPTHPILAKKFLDAIDRRVETVLEEVLKCVKKAKNKPKAVFMNKFKQGLFRRGLTRQISMSNSNSAETMTQDLDYQPNELQGIHRVMGQVHQIEDTTGVGESNNEHIPRPTPNNDMVTFLQEKLRPFPEVAEPCPDEMTREQHMQQQLNKDNDWHAFYAEMSNCYLYKKDSAVVGSLLRNMNTMDITHVIPIREAAQFRTTLRFGNKGAIFKPMRFSRFYETDPNHFYFDDFERPHAEIAAFHLDRLLGFRHVAPIVGRVFNVRNDLVNKANKQLIYYRSPAGADCFFLNKGTCKYCDLSHAYCGNPDKIKGSVQLWLPALDERIFKRRLYDPFKPNRRCILRFGVKAKGAIQEWPASVGLGNQDRDQYKVFRFGEKDPETFIYVTENGKAFGNPNDDDHTILAPLMQCCIVRPSTVRTLLNFYNGRVSLGQSLENSLNEDPLRRILARKYLVAINYRVEKILYEVSKCLMKAAESGDLKGVFMNSYKHECAAGDC